MMASVSLDSLHPDLAKNKFTTAKPIYFRIALETLELVYLVEGGYLTENNHLWIPSWAKVWKKKPTSEKESYDGAITKDGKWYAPKGEVDTSFAMSTPYEALPPEPESSEESRSWVEGKKVYRFFQHFKNVRTVSYRASQDDNWVFCPTSDWCSL